MVKNILRKRLKNLKIKKHTDETKLKMSLKRRGRFVGEKSPLFGVPKTKEHRENMSKSKIGKNLGENHPNFGKTLPQSWKDKISKARKESGLTKGGNHPLAKIVLNLETGIFYECIKDASEAHDLKYDRLKYLLRHNKIKNLTLC